MVKSLKNDFQESSRFTVYRENCELQNEQKQKGQDEIQLLKTEVQQLKQQLSTVTNMLQTIMTVQQFVQLLQSQSKVVNLTLQVDKIEIQNCAPQFTNQVMRYPTQPQKPIGYHNFSVTLNKPLLISHVTLCNPSGDSKWASLRIQGASDLIIEHNTFNGVGLNVNVKSVKLNKVDVLNTGGTGISVSNSTKCEMIDVNIAHCKGGGCRLTNCQEVQLTNTKISGCNGVGFSSYSSTFNMQNLLVDSCNYGINLSGNSSNSSYGTYDQCSKLTRVRGYETQVDKDSKWLKSQE
eukprot:TRINITY_DN2050_c0_g1_i9.p1 TRINITY_DN2050_c0_g1~~TRINITY_DN2050_c0_g1_i9.p1  ORF type:complete len:293 (-),score=5.52 TRINITY_DN2050_c0_g1_i9:259-1137(-)